MTCGFPSSKFSGWIGLGNSRIWYLPSVGSTHENFKGYCKNGIQISIEASFPKAFLASRAITRLHCQSWRSGESIESVAFARYLLRKPVPREQKLSQSCSAFVLPA